jgi:hypothetical protein
MTKEIWKPQAGSQALFLTCPFYEVLYEGTRGPGKTDALIMDFAQHVGQGFGIHWRGILFRETYKQLIDVEKKTKQWFRQIFPGAKFNSTDMTWTFKDGEQLILSYMRKPDDYWNYHGHEYPWIGWEELTNWPTSECYDLMKACSRSSHPDMPRKYRATCNPYGVGHGWVKMKFIDPAPAGTPIADKDGNHRIRLFGSIYENLILLKNDPNYLKNLESIDDENLKEAWLYGNWNIVAGGMFTEYWDEKTHIIEPFNIPSQWRIDRAFDWGSSKPFSVGWYAESDGSEVKMNDGTIRNFPRGTVFRIAEYYGWNGKPNQGVNMLAREIARKIKDYEKSMGLNVKPGAADTSIYDAVNGMCIADDMAAIGIKWTKADKRPGSRVSGWEKIKQYLKASKKHPMEEPGIFIFSTCRQFARTFPTLVRDDKKPDDIDTDQEDHIADEFRYRIMGKKNTIENQSISPY